METQEPVCATIVRAGFSTAHTKHTCTQAAAVKIRSLLGSFVSLLQFSLAKTVDLHQLQSCPSPVSIKKSCCIFSLAGNEPRFRQQKIMSNRNHTMNNHYFRGKIQRLSPGRTAETLPCLWWQVERQKHVQMHKQRIQREASIARCQLRPWRWHHPPQILLQQVLQISTATALISWQYSDQTIPLEGALWK